MKDQNKTKKQLVSELAELRQRCAELEKSEAEHKRIAEGQRKALAEALQATQALRESEERYRLLVENSHDIAYSITPDGIVTFVSPQIIDLGYAPEEVISRHFSEFVAPDFRQVVLDNFKKGTASGESFQTVFQLQDKEGKTCWVETVGRTMYDESGCPLLQIGVLRDITERKRAEESLGRHNRELALLNRLGRELTSTLNLQWIMDQLLREATEIVNAEGASVWLWDEAQEGWLVCEAASHYDLKRSLHNVRLRPGQGIAGWVAQTGESAVVTNASDDARFFSGIDEHTGLRTTSLLTVPLRVHGEVIGTLEMMNKLEGNFDADDLALIETLAASAAVAIENANLVQREREQRELVEALAEAAAAFSSILAPDRVFDRILEQVERIFAGEAFSIMLLSEDGIARVARWRGHEQMGLTGTQIIQVAVPIAEHVEFDKMLQTGEPIIVTDAATSHTGMLPEGWEWLKSFIVAPIRVTGRAVGFLNVCSTQVGQFGPTDARRLQAFANHAATAIENARLHRALQGYADQLEQRVAKRTAELEAQYARSEAVLRSISDGIVVTNAGGEILQANPVAQAWLGETLSLEDAERLREAIQDLARQANDTPELMLETTGIDLVLSAAPVTEVGARESFAVVVCIHDVSHLKALDRMKTVFIANTSDELRHPVTTIKSYAYLVQRTSPENEKWHLYLNALVQEANQQAQLVEEIMQISRIYTGRLEMEPHPTSLDRLIQTIVAGRQSLAQERRVTLEYQPTPSLPGEELALNSAQGRDEGLVALVDSQQMAQVLSYLVDDAIHYTLEGGQVVISTGWQEAEEHIWATVTISDMGEAIPAEDLPHIFERFFREEEPRSVRVSTTGLRLMIVKGIVELHRGRVTVESEKDLGSTFTIWLPLAGEKTHSSQERIPIEKVSIE